MALNDDIDKGKKAVKETAEEVAFLGDAFKSLGATISSAIEGAVDSMGDLDDVGQAVAKSYQRDIVGSIKQISKSVEGNVQLQLKLNKGVNIQKELEKEKQSLQARQQVTLAKINTTESLSKKQKDKLIAQLNEQFEIQQDILTAKGEENTQNQKNKSFTKILKENAGGIADKLDKTGTLSKILSGNLKDTLTPIRLLELAAVATFKAFKESDKAVGEMAKSMGVSYNEAKDLRSELTKISFQSDSIFVNTKNMQESMMALNKEFGTATSFSSEMLEDFTRLTKEAGYSAEAAGSLAKITVLTGTDLSDNVETILGQAQAYNAVNKVSLNTKQLTEDVAKTSAATTLSLGANPKLIASANIAARALGTSLEKVEAISSSLLNFEQSISNELEAELMIGKELNLEVAREAALRGDVGKVAEEVAKQVGTSAEFGAMNVLQQEALAKAVGMTREDLAKSLIEKENLVKLGTKDKDLQSSYNTLKKQGLSDDQIAAKLGDDKLTQQLASVSIQERLTASVEKMKEVFIAIAEPLMALINPIVDILSPAITFISKTVGYIVEGFKVMGPVLKVILGIAGAIAIVMKRTAIMAAIKGLWSGLGSIPFIGPALAIAGIAGAVGYINSQKIGDGAFGADGSTQISTKEGGLFEISPNDDVVVAPGAIDKMNQPGGGNNQSGVISELRKQNSILMQILQKDTNIEIDGTILNKKVQQSLSSLG
tara:strand:+ start:765 stop:2909 length:2145 start_codon:yes stop_codon:yes gene_type:complete